jgi:hypothetical protein
MRHASRRHPSIHPTDICNDDDGSLLRHSIINSADAPSAEAGKTSQSTTKASPSIIGAEASTACHDDRS